MRPENATERLDARAAPGVQGENTEPFGAVIATKGHAVPSPSHVSLTSNWPALPLVVSNAGGASASIAASKRSILGLLGLGAWASAASVPRSPSTRARQRTAS